MQENASLREAIAVAQQQLHEAAAAAASRVLAEKALEGEQQARQALEQAHLLVRAFLPTVCAYRAAFDLCLLTCLSVFLDSLRLMWVVRSHWVVFHHAY